MKDPYAALGISADADAKRIKAAYRRMARATHPDAGGEVFAFRAVQDAYELLSDPARRASHDSAVGGSSEDMSTPASSKHRSPAGKGAPGPAREQSWLDRLVAPPWYERIPTGPPRVRPGWVLVLASTWAPFFLTLLLTVAGGLLGGPGAFLWMFGGTALIPLFVPAPIPLFKLRAVALLVLLFPVVFALPAWWGASPWWQSARPWAAAVVASICALALIALTRQQLQLIPVSEARDANQFSVVGDAAADPAAASFGSLFLVIPAARLILGRQRGVDAWVLVGRRAIAITRQDVSVRAPWRLQVRVHTVDEIVGNAQELLEELGEWLLDQPKNVDVDRLLLARLVHVSCRHRKVS